MRRLPDRAVRGGISSISKSFARAQLLDGGELVAPLQIEPVGGAMRPLWQLQMPRNAPRIGPVRRRYQNDTSALLLALTQKINQGFFVGQCHRIELHLAGKKGFENRRPL